MGQRILRMTGDFFVQILGPGKSRQYEVVEDALPPDTKIVNAKVSIPYFVGTDELALLLESAEWSDPPSGQPIPEIRPMLRVITE